MESKNLSYSLKVNEFAALTTRSDETESVSWYTGYKPNNVWSDLKHSRRALSLKFLMLTVRSTFVQPSGTVHDRLQWSVFSQVNFKEVCVARTH